MTLGDKIWEAQQVYFLANGKYAEKFDQLDVQLPSPQAGSTENMFSYSWGKCRTLSDNSGYCAIYIQGKSLYFFRSYDGSNRYCRAYTGGQAGTVVEKICLSLGGENPQPNTNLGYVQYTLP